MAAPGSRSRIMENARSDGEVLALRRQLHMGPISVGGTAILFTAEDHGASPMFAAFPAEENPIPQHQGTPSQKLHVDDLVFAGRSLFFTRMSAIAPNEIYKLEMPQNPELGTYISEPWQQITHIN